MDGQVRTIRHTSEYWDHYGVFVHKGLQQPGDLVVLSKNGLCPSHIGFVLSDDKYIHASGSDGTDVRISEIEKEDIATPEDCTQTQLYNKNPIGFKGLVTVHENPTYRYHQMII